LISRDLIGRTQSRSILVERGPLSFFARSIGETNPIYFDVDAAREQGHPDLVAPPSYLFSLLLFAEADHPWVIDLGVDLSKILHGEQRFEYDGLVFAGETLTLKSAITEIYEKRGGALEFVERASDAFVGEQRRGRLVTTLVVRHG
jgi:acyl dehydratase